MAVTIPPATAPTTAPTTSAQPRRRWGGLTAWRPPMPLVRAFAWAAVITNGLIAVTGATVRVTGSGLGCATWPQCQPGSLVPEYRTGLAAIHQAIEFGNRTITGLVLVASLGAFVLIALLRPVRRQLLLLAGVGPAGVLFQAVWGGIVVRQELAWWTVAPHLLVSLALLFAAVLVLVRLREGDGPVRLLVPRPLHVLAWVTVAELTLLCVAGTLVTAAGPHAGDVNTPRLGLPVATLAQAHADLMFLYLGLVAALGVGFLAVRAPRRLLVRTGVLVGITLAQGAIGLTQYWLGVPELLVLLHVLGAVCLIGAAAAMTMSTRTRDRAPAAEPGPATP